MILITGATGYIGRHLIARLAGQDEQLRCLVRNKQRAAQILPVDKITLVQGTTTQPATLEEAVHDVDIIVHAAFLTADRKESPGNRYEDTNVRGTANLIMAAQAAGVKHVIEISGLGTKPAKPGSYMQGRYLAEKMLMESSLNWTIIRPSVIFGKNAPFIKGLTNLITTAPVVPLLGGGNIQFQLIHIEDVVSVIIKVLRESEQRAGNIYTIGGPAYLSFREIIDALLKSMHKKRAKVYVPMPLVGVGAAVMEAVLPSPPLTKAAMSLFTFDNVTDLKSVECDFGFTPLSFTTYLDEHGI